MPPLPGPQDVLSFWFEELTAEQWFKRDGAVDERIRAGFADVYEALRDSVPSAWTASARGMLAAVIVLDQFPRNMFRDDPRAFATDAAALALSEQAIERGLAEALDVDERKFLYMPFQHAEDTAIQARSIELFATIDENTLDFARRHKSVIDRFGRFPHRNAVLERPSTAEEAEFLEQPGSSF